jgi:putative glutamine amidotransferase
MDSQAHLGYLSAQSIATRPILAHDPRIKVMDLEALLDNLDGVVMTGAPSNVHPPHYGEEASADHEPYDHERDSTSLDLISRVIAKGMPLFCICRGFQELNVVLGGTLETELQRTSGRLDHRSRQAEDLDTKYGPAHPITITPGGMLARILGKSQTMVNTLHRQGIKKLASSLIMEACAPDGVIEAASVKGAASFALGTQWHPEYKAAQNADSVKLFTAFGDAVRSYRALKLAGPARQAASG